MPDTHAHHRHRVRLYRVAADEKPNELGHMEGLELVLGKASGTGSAALDSLAWPHGGRVVDLTQVTADANGSGGLKAFPDLVNGTPNEVVSRVKIGEGRAVRREAEAYWRFKNDVVYMAHTLTWEIDDVPDLLVWNRMSGTTSIPLMKLSDLGPQQPLPVCNTGEEQKHGYCILVSHTMGNGIPGAGKLDEKAVKEHFRHFYDALDHEPRPGELPDLESDERSLIDLGKFNCGAAQVELG
jgi:hypothetical protein